jgi:hypothetical protein
LRAQEAGTRGAPISGTGAPREGEVQPEEAGPAGCAFHPTISASKHSSFACPVRFTPPQKTEAAANEGCSLHDKGGKLSPYAGITQIRFEGSEQ